MEILYKKENYILAKKVFIDPGHGGNDSGAVGINNLLEKDKWLILCSSELEGEL